MRKIIAGIKRFLSNDHIFVEKEYREEFVREGIKDNFTRLAVTSVVLFVIECYVYFSGKNLFHTNPVVLRFLFASIVFLPILWLIKFRADKVNVKFALTVQYLYIALCILFGVALALYVQNETDLIHMYLMMVFFSAAFITMIPFGSAILFLTTYTCFLLLLPYYSADAETLTVIQINTGGANIGAWVMSNMLWRVKIAAFANRKTLYKKNVILKELSKKDSMTGLYNHEASLGILEKEIDRSREMNSPISLIIADIDNFKNINDGYGHLLGDEVIKVISGKIAAAVRKTDFVGRYGGDEFIIIMPDTDLNAALALANRIKSKIEENSVHDDISVTLSGGISQYACEPLNEFIRITDQKLYTAKNTGKNKFETELAKPGEGALEKVYNTI